MWPARNIALRFFSLSVVNTTLTMSKLDKTATKLKMNVKDFSGTLSSIRGTDVAEGGPLSLWYELLWSAVLKLNCVEFVCKFLIGGIFEGERQAHELSGKYWQLIQLTQTPETFPKAAICLNSLWYSDEQFNAKSISQNWQFVILSTSIFSSEGSNSMEDGKRLYLFPFKLRYRSDFRGSNTSASTVWIWLFCRTLNRKVQLDY